MKLFLAVLLVAAVSAKPEIKFKNSCADPLVKVLGVDDEKKGSCTLDSVLLLDFDTSEDTWTHEPSTQTTELIVSKWMFVRYIKVPFFLLDLVCKKAQGLFPGKLECLGKGDRGGYKISIPCFMKKFTGHCLPKVGKSHLRFPIKQNMELLREMFNGLFAGWVKVELETTSPSVTDKTVFCVEAEAKVDL